MIKTLSFCRGFVLGLHQVLINHLSKWNFILSYVCAGVTICYSVCSSCCDYFNYLLCSVMNFFCLAFPELLNTEAYFIQSRSMMVMCSQYRSVCISKNKYIGQSAPVRLVCWDKTDHILTFFCIISPYLNSSPVFYRLLYVGF